MVIGPCGADALWGAWIKYEVFYSSPRGALRAPRGLAPAGSAGGGLVSPVPSGPGWGPGENILRIFYPRIKDFQSFLPVTGWAKPARD